MQEIKQRVGRRKQPVRVLVVQDDAQIGAAVRERLLEWGAQVDWVRTLREATEACGESYRVLIVDVQLPDGSGVTLAERAIHMRPVPLIVAMSGRSAAREAFRMAQLGAVGFLQKPFEPEELGGILHQLFESDTARLQVVTEPEYMRHMVAIVGRTNFREVLDRVRRSMAEQALFIAAGNKTAAARLLGITRQAVQQLIRDLHLHDPQVAVFDVEACTGEVPPPEPLAEVAAARRCN